MPWLRWLRRAHLYLGLLLMPWAVLFGLTALSFNHPAVGRGLTTHTVNASDLARWSDFEPLDPSSLAQQLTAQLSKDGLSVVDGSPRFSGWPLFARPAPGGLEVVIVNLEGKSAHLTRRPAAPEAAEASFSGTHINLPGVDMAAVAQSLNPLHKHLGVATSGPLRPHPQVHPELRFMARKHNGDLYQINYDLTTETVRARLSDRAAPSNQATQRPWIEVLESLHTQHHYPVDFGPTFVWAIISDVMAGTLLFWAVSGLLMWWQMRKLRVIGAAAVCVAVGLAAFVMTTTAQEINFGVSPVHEE